MADISRLVLEVDSSGVVQATGNLNEFSRAASNSQNAAGSAGGSVATLDGIFGQLNLSAIAGAAGIKVLVDAFSALSSAAVQFGKDSVKAYASFEEIQNGLSGALGDAEKGKEFFEDLRSFSFETTFGVDTLADASSQLLNIGMAAKKIKPSLKMLGDAAGGDTAKFKELVDIFAKIQNTGKATSQQLQQLALRGIPIYNILKQMGVEGTASADDITRAFEKMTAEFDEATGKAGIFYNNMQSINETIAGKEGFVSDTFRELLASFAEASGLAMLYKQALDLVYNALQGLVNFLAAINENPVYKAIFQGVLVGAITAITVAVGVGLVMALKKVVIQLGLIAALKAMINPASVAIGIGVAAGAVAGLGVALNGLARKESDMAAQNDSYAESLKKIAPISESVASQIGIVTNAMNEQVIAIGDTEYKIKELMDIQEKVGSKEWKKENKKNKKELKRENVDSFLNEIVQERQIKDYEEALKGVADAMMEYEYAQQDARNAGMFNQFMENYADDYVKKIEIAKRKVEALRPAYEAVLAIQEASNRAVEEHEKRLQEVEEANRNYADSIALINSVYEQTDEGKEAKRVADIKEQIRLLEEAKKARQKEIAMVGNSTNAPVETVLAGLGLSSEDLAKADKAIAYLTSLLEKPKEKVKEEKKELEEFQKVMQRLFNFSDADVTKYLQTGLQGVKEYARRVGEESEKMKGYWDLIYGADKSTASIAAENAKKLYADDAKILQDLLTARSEKTGNLIWTGEEESIKVLKERVRLEKEAALNADFSVAIESLVKEGRQLGKNARQLEVMEQLAKGYSRAQAEMYAGMKMSNEYAKRLDALYEEGEQIGKNKRELEEMSLIAEGFTKEQAKAAANIKLSNGFEKQLESLRQQKDLLGKSAEEMSYMQHILDGMNEGQAAALANTEAQLKKMQELADATYLTNRFSEMVRMSSEEYNANGRQDLDKGMYLKGKAGGAAMDLIQGTDVGSAVEGFQQAGVWGAVINTFVNALSDAIGGIENIQLILSPIRMLLKSLSPLIKALLYPLAYVGQLFAKLGEAIVSFLNVITFGLVEKLSVSFDELTQAQEDETERLRRLNEQYKNLQNAIDEQEQYYLKKKMEVNAQAYDKVLGNMQVNDMILTPQGNFSTDPDDYIIATKNPAGIGGGTVFQMNVEINNTIAETATVTTSQTTNADGMPQLLVTISRKVAGDAASGANGWDNAFSARSQRLSGRMVTA